ncbi:MAG: preprotein translocase subunit SecG [Candidatus Omnitrophica bacterium]|nr:preprotein translocase subunit SecG [Candidatus Omnitrophota bacterium]
MIFLIVIHVTTCTLLIGIILIQSGRGGGLVESFSGVESMFGTKTSAFLTRSTTVLSTIFFITCVSLALLSARQSRSLLRGAPAPTEQTAVPAASGPAKQVMPEAAKTQENTPAPQAEEKKAPEEAPKTE